MTQASKSLVNLGHIMVIIKFIVNKIRVSVSVLMKAVDLQQKLEELSSRNYRTVIQKFDDEHEINMNYPRDLPIPETV